MTRSTMAASSILVETGASGRRRAGSKGVALVTGKLGRNPVGQEPMRHFAGFEGPPDSCTGMTSTGLPGLAIEYSMSWPASP